MTFEGETMSKLQPRRRTRVAVAVVVAAAAVASVLAVSSPAPAAVNARIVAGPAAFVRPLTYLTPVAVMQKGGSAVFTNLDVALHDVRHSAARPKFKSPLIGFGRSAAVNGVRTLAKGSYRFHCTIHPWMTGTLRVV